MIQQDKQWIDLKGEFSWERITIFVIQIWMSIHEKIRCSIHWLKKSKSYKKTDKNENESSLRNTIKVKIVNYYNDTETIN